MGGFAFFFLNFAHIIYLLLFYYLWFCDDHRGISFFEFSEVLQLDRPYQSQSSLELIQKRSLERCPHQGDEVNTSLIFQFFSSVRESYQRFS